MTQYQTQKDRQGENEASLRLYMFFSFSLLQCEELKQQNKIPEYI